MYINDFYRNFFVPVCLSRVKIGTRRLYDQIIELWISDVGNLEIHEINPAHCQQFVDSSLEKVSPASVAKYCRHLNTIFLKASKPGYRNREAFGFISDPPYCRPPKLMQKLPKQVSDRQLIRLIETLGENDEYPKTVEKHLRRKWWKALCLFAATTAVRREVIFSVTWEHVDLSQHIFFVSPEIDKVCKERIKFLHEKLVRLLLEIRTEQPHVFHWTHGNKKFYELWTAANEKCGFHITLHDLKRYASQLAIRSGADVATLREFCDHTDINTTLKHYARGNVQGLIANLQIPAEVWRD